MEHAVHLASRHFIEKISPTPARLIKKKIHGRHRRTAAAMVDEDDEDDEDGSKDEGFNNNDLSIEVEEAEDDNGETEAVIEEYDAADVVGKCLAMVTQVCNISTEYRSRSVLIFFQICASPQARSYLKQLCIEEKLPPHELRRWVRTRWASLSHFFGMLLELKPVSWH
jgi:hypothetical protein